MGNKNLASIRRLTQALLVSGALNIGLMAFLFYWLVKEVPPQPYFELKPAAKQEQQQPIAIPLSNQQVLRFFKKLPFEQLVAKLSNPQLVENGYTQRDLALAILTSIHYLDISRALKGQSEPIQQRKILLDENDGDITIFPGLSEMQYQVIAQFINSERWPFTSHGLFKQLQSQNSLDDSSLVDAFSLTSEFSAVDTLFARGSMGIDKLALLRLILEGNWATLSAFAEQQRASQDLSPARRQRLLLDYIALNSRSAALFLLKSDADFAAKKLDDNQVLAILSLLEQKTSEGEQFALTLLMSPRSDAVWQKAASRLYEYAGEPKPLKNVHHAALLRFVPQQTPTVPLEKNVLKKPNHSSNKSATKESNKPVPKESKIIAAVPAKKTSIPRTYVIQEGDSLWKIAKKFKVSTEAIMKHNQLKSDVLKPGVILKIPNSN